MHTSSLRKYRLVQVIIYRNIEGSVDKLKRTSNIMMDRSREKLRRVESNDPILKVILDWRADRTMPATNISQRGEAQEEVML